MAIMAALDTNYISNFYAIPESNIQSLVSAPTTDLVTTFLRAVISKAQEYDKQKADQLRLEVELDNAVRSADARARTLKTNTDKALRDVEALQTRLNEEENARAKLTDQLQTIQSDSSTTSVQVEALQAQVSKLEKQNRDAVALVDSKTTDLDKLNQDLASQHEKTISIRREVAALSEKLQTADTSLSSAKILETQLRAEIEQQRRNSDWLDSELKTKAAEHGKFRKEKNARITELQRLNDDATSNVEMLERTEAAIRKRLEDMERKLNESFSHAQHSQEEAVRNEQSFRHELDTARRLAELHQQSAGSARRRVQELEEGLEQFKDEAGEEIAQNQAEIETERQLKEAAERRVEELEGQIEKLEASGQPVARGRSPTLTRGGINGISTPLRTGSPMAFSPGSRSRGGLNYTQLYSDYTNTLTELDSEKRRNEKLTQTLDDLIQEMEKREPEIQEVHMDHERLESENAELARLLAATREEKDVARREARKGEGAVTGARREVDLLKQQLRDLSSQIKILLVEVQARDEGVELTATERLQLQQSARSNHQADDSDDISDTARFISERLVPFRSISELQEKNTELLRIVRELGEQKESEESKAAAQTQAKTEAELESLREGVEKHKDEIRTMVTQSQSYIRERDMFRRMLSHRGQLPPEADLESMFGASVNGPPATPRTPRNNTTTAPVDQTPSAKDIADYSRLLKDLQGQFDAYRREMATDYKTVKEQASSLAKDKTNLQADVARVNSQLTLASERYRMLQANFDQLKTENSELRKRLQSLAEVATRQDLKTQQVAEELVEARGTTDGLRHENANLKAEKELWRKIETRLSEDNKALSEERSRLNKALTDSQTLANEREVMDSEMRRKMLGQVEALETQLRTTNQKLEQELEGSKNLSMRREFEIDQHRSRVDDLMKALGTSKEELLITKTTRDQLQARIEELKIDLRNAEDRVQALQPRPAGDVAVSSASQQDSSLSNEQQLALEVAELKKQLDLKQTELETAQTQAEQFRKISQSSEEELQTLTDAHDEYQKEVEQVLVEKDSSINDFKIRVEEISNELLLTNEQLTAVRSAAEEASVKLNSQRSQFDEQLSRVKDEAESYKEAAAFHEEDLKAQAEIAQQAQKNYENELVRHGEATKALQAVRGELNTIRLEVAQHKTDAETATTTMTQNEDSWSLLKDRYEAEIAESKTRRDVLNDQNKTLHVQLETFSRQIGEWQQKRDPGHNEIQSEGIEVPGMVNQQRLISFVQNEKDIMSVQLDAKEQETRRLKQQIEYITSELDAARLKLDQERHRQTEREQNAINHSKLMDTINELNVFRESSVTLRNESRQAQAQLAEKSKQVDELLAQLEPLRSKLHDITNEQEGRQAEYKLLEEDRDRWQQRAHNILQKYDRIDPAELEALKEQLSALQKERDESGTQIQTLQEQVDGFAEQLREATEEAKRDVRQRLGEQFKARSRELSAKINETTNQSKRFAEQVEEITSELATARAELYAAKAARDEALAHVESLNSQLAELRANSTEPPKPDNGADSMEEGQVVDADASVIESSTAVLENRLKAEEAKVAEAQQQATNAQAEVESLRAQAVDLQGQVQALEAQIASLTAELIDFRSRVESGEPVTPTADFEKVKLELAAAQQELETMRQNNASQLPEKTIPSGEATAPAAVEQVEQQIADVRAELDSTYKQRTEELEQAFSKRVEDMKQQLNQKLNQGKQTYRNQVAKEHEDAMQKLRQEYADAETKLKKEHETFVVQLKSDHAQQLASLPATEKPAQALATGQADAAGWKPEEVRAFITTNQTARDILTRNIKTKVEQATTRLEEQHAKEIAELKIAVPAAPAEPEAPKPDYEQALAEEVKQVKSRAAAEAAKTLAEQLEEAKQRADRSKEQAVTMESKKWTAKVSMAEGRSRAALAKIEFVSNAAKSTPQRPVAEVWEEAKDIKATPSQPSVTVATTLPSSSPVVGQVAQSPTVRGPSTAAATTAAAPATPAAAGIPASGVANSFSPANQPLRRQSTQPRMDAAPANVAHSTPAAAFPDQAQSYQPPSGLPPRPQPPQQVPGTAFAGNRVPSGQGSGIPRGGASIRGIARGGRGGAPDGYQVHNALTQAPPLPSAADQASNQRSGFGSGIPRGGASNRGRGRGQMQQGGGAGAGSGPDSPGGGRGGMNMNPAAHHFQPGGVKRHRDDSPAGGDDKRARGGGGGN